MPGQVDGFGLAAIGIGAIFVYGGIKGVSPLKALANVVSGKAPATGQTPGTVSLLAPDTSGNSPLGPGGLNTNVKPASGSQTDWIKALLSGISAPQTQANINSIVSWMAHEEPTSDWSHWNNPLNTTLNYGGGVSQNSVGVKSYPSLQIGLQATIITLNGYSDIVMALRSGQGLCGKSLSGLSKWSGGGYSSVC